MVEPADTPTAILACAADLLRENMFDDISYGALGDAVGVSERTVYRHYPTRSHLLEALARRIEEREFPLRPFVSIPQFEAAVRARFHDYDSSPAFAFVCARAATISPTIDAEPAFLSRAIEALLAIHAPTLNMRDLRRLTATFQYFASAQFWARMRTGFDMSADEIADVFDRTARTALDAASAGRPSRAPSGDASRTNRRDAP
ncbi:TetR/AcrR family transcriptional regulator [Microbacterium ulmi]|uniref:TetR/AcrR family transcriptional regulator n=1 Tax=Microbacterium ulmi TaxID=179095 RepID=A0A7Y2Q1D0_9MICO|nr:TetR/AcrR family transcriptional regulator [Microbacterium ulmi]NII69559.1 AcrR family transcriptional regulator [Microbacterium ulmi]NNH03553.1 TetR/AcrR family transcriptional regulator [Microbacterium ulmi]